jgi:hypothetical protein
VLSQILYDVPVDHVEMKEKNSTLLWQKIIEKNRAQRLCCQILKKKSQAAIPPHSELTMILNHMMFTSKISR